MTDRSRNEVNLSLRFVQAPGGELPPDALPRVVVAVKPTDPRIRVSMKLIVNGKDYQRKVPLRRERKTKDEQFFEAGFPSFRPGDHVQYAISAELQRGQETLRVSSVESDGGWREFKVGSSTEISQNPIRPARSTSSEYTSSKGPPTEETTPPTDRDQPVPVRPNTTLLAARIAGLSKDATSRILKKAPEILLLDTQTARELVDEGTLGVAEADKLAVAKVALEVTGGDEETAGKVMTTLESRGIKKPKDLAGMKSDDIAKALEEAGAGDREVAAERAKNLRAGVSKVFATETLSPLRVVLPPSPSGQRIPRGLVKPEAIRKAWKNNAELDLLRMDISKDSSDRKRLNLAGLQAEERKAFIRDVQERRGALIAAGRADIAEKLLEKGIKSAAAVSPARLAKETGISLARAKKIHERDIQRYGRLSQGLFALIDAHSGGLQDTAVGNLRRDKVVDFVQQAESPETFDSLDNMQELFGNLDSCHCEHCNSILGPAAYFVDLMHFVQKHVLDEDLEESDSPPFRGKQNHKLHLKTRRPDLWVLPLTCENTHTEIPQLQITSEIFENFIAKKHGTTVTSDRKEVVAAVYGDVLLNAKDSVLQPFHLPIEELEVYLGHFKLRRSDIAELLDEPEEVWLRAVLFMSKAHADLITVPDASPANIEKKLGLTLPADRIVPIKSLLTATQLPRKDLGELLQTRFVVGPQPLTIKAEKKSSESVQFDIERVHGVTLEHLDRIHRLLRFQQHLPWLPKELDGFLASVGGGLDRASIIDAGRAALLKARFKASAQELCAIGGDLPEFSIERQRSPGEKERTPFDVLFNVPDLMREEGISYPAPGLRYSASESSLGSKEGGLRLRAGLRLDEGDLKALVEGLEDAFDEGDSAGATATQTHFFPLRLHQSPRPFLPPLAPPVLPKPLPTIGDGTGSFPLSRRNLSLLYRHVVLARWLKLKVTDLLTLVRLTPGVGTQVRNLREAVTVVRFYDWWKRTRLSLEDLVLLLAPAEALTEQVEDLWEALQAWLREQDEISLTDTFLTQLEGVSEELSRELVALNTETVFDADGDQFRVAASADLDGLDLTPLENTEVDGEAVRSLVRAYHPDERLPRALTEALRTDIDLARAVVAVALAGDGAPSAAEFLQEGTLQESSRAVLMAILRLHRIGIALRLAPATLRFFAEHQANFGIEDWLAPNPAALRRIAATQALLKRSFREDPDVALMHIARLFTDRTVLPETAVRLFEIEPALTKDLVDTIRLPDNAIDALFKLDYLAAVANKLSVDAPTLSGIVSEDYDLANAASAAVIAGFRAKYSDEETWKEKVEPYQERVLERKRDALIDYLLRGLDVEFSDTKEIYKYFLIDGQVDGCFRTSRVVAACSSLQFYVHRIRMNLEKEPDGGVHVLPSLIPDDEWEWRQHYRVWEANRKIFLWPENYLDPTIRDDKTPLLEELESELLQQEITDQTVMDAYSNYLKSLEELANLRYAGAYHHYIEAEDSGEATDIIYLFGATGGEAPTHYWREIRNLARSQEDELVSPEYGPWRKVETRIPTRHISPVVYDGRLYVFWNEITTTSQNAVHDGKSRFIGYSHRYALKFTSLRLDGQWTPPEIISLRGAAPTFKETDSSIDDPLTEQSELEYFNQIFNSFFPFFGTYSDSDLPRKLKSMFADIEQELKDKMKISGPGAFDQAVRQLATPRFGIDMHTKAREGYTLEGFMWERPYLSADPSYDERLLINCAGFLVRGAVDLFDRIVIPADNTEYKFSGSVGSDLLAYHHDLQSYLAATYGLTDFFEGAPDFTLLRRDDNYLWQAKWPSCVFDYPVAASLALSLQDPVFGRHWGPLELADGHTVAEVAKNAGVWAVGGTPREVIIETEEDMLLLQPNLVAENHYILYRLGTTLVRDVARKLFTEGVDGLLAIGHQQDLLEPEPKVSGSYTHDCTVKNPIANEAPYGIYYQEIFQHIPLLIAHHLNARNKFEDAQRWYHYVFDPTSPEPPTEEDALPTDRSWKYRQFRGQEQKKLRDVLSDKTAIEKYRKDPFNAHAIARLRVSAYQKAVVMRYIDNLLDWADERFTRFQMETVNEAMMLYLTAAEILGPRPVQLGECGEVSDSTRTYNKLKASIHKDESLLLEVEQLIPGSRSALPSRAGSGLVRPAFGLKGFLAFPWGKGSTGGVSTKRPPRIAGSPSLLTGGEEPRAMTPGAFAKSSERTARDLIGSREVPMAKERTSRPESPSLTTASSSIRTPRQSVSPMASSPRTTATTRRTRDPIGPFSSDETARGTSESRSGASAGRPGATMLGDRRIADVSTVGAAEMLEAGSTMSFTKAAKTLPLTEELVQSFSLRQQFRFLGGGWKMKGGRLMRSTLGDRFGRAVVRQVSAAFCIPRNEILADYWNRVEDRIQKIRTCRDISGRRRKLSLFAPEIDPMLLARARAVGIPLDDALGAFEGMIPRYRFRYLLQKAKEFAGTVQSFGAALQSALERKDAEELARLQTTQQQNILALTTKAKKWELQSATANLEATERRKAAVENRRAHYSGVMEAGLNAWEHAQGLAAHMASIIQGSVSASFNLAGALGLCPQGGSPFALTYGGIQVEKGPTRVAQALGALASAANAVATSAAIEANHERRREDWEFQRDQSEDELCQIEKQIEAARIACDLAEHAIKLHEKNIEHNDELLEYHEDKFSDLGLYDWLATQLQRAYREAYNMAYRMARYAEQAYRFEREDYTSELQSGQHWEAARAGLLAGNRLTLDLQYLEQRYIETDQPKREVKDHFFSLRQWYPRALIKLRQTGECIFSVPELFFDLASPGDYRRRLRSVRLTMPTVTGPYANVMATLSLNSSQMRYEPGDDPQDAPRPRLDSITTSSARNDAGAFELDFRGEKYVPFEGAGAVSEWSLSLPSAVKMFDYSTISDVVLHLDYTASFSETLRNVVQGVTGDIAASVKDQLAIGGIDRACSLKEEFPSEYKRLMAGETAEIEITTGHLPYFLRSARVKAASLVLTGLKESDPNIGDVELNGTSLGQPAVDDSVGGLSLSLRITGEGPWRHSLRIAGAPTTLDAYLVLHLTASE